MNLHFHTCSEGGLENPGVPLLMWIPAIIPGRHLVFSGSSSNIHAHICCLQ